MVFSCPICNTVIWYNMHFIFVHIVLFFITEQNSALIADLSAVQQSCWLCYFVCICKKISVVQQCSDPSPFFSSKLLPLSCNMFFQVKNRRLIFFFLEHFALFKILFFFDDHLFCSLWTIVLPQLLPKAEDRWFFPELDPVENRRPETILKSAITTKLRKAYNLLTKIKETHVLALFTIVSNFLQVVFPR